MFPELLITPDSYTKDGGICGRGTFGDVYKGVMRTTKEVVAVKVLRVSEHMFQAEAEQKAFVRELAVLARLKHPGVLGLVGFHVPQFGETSEKEIPESPTIVTKWMAHGSVGDAISNELDGQPILGWNPTKKSKCIFGIAAAMSYVHSRSITHRDLKPQNVMLNDDFEPVLVDFGLSRVVSVGIDMTRKIGSPFYMAPELFAEDVPTSLKIDVFSYGVMLYTMFTKALELDDRPGRPSRSIEQFLMRVMNGARLVRVTEINEFYWDLITRCWDKEPNKRPTFEEIVRHLKANQERYKIDGTDVAELSAYEEKVTANRRLAIEEVPSDEPEPASQFRGFDDDDDE
jgi:serine/threonine protein kinase